MIAYVDGITWQWGRAGVQTSCTSIRRREVALRLSEGGKGLVSELGPGRRQLHAPGPGVVGIC